MEPAGQFELGGAPNEDLHQTAAETESHLVEVCCTGSHACRPACLGAVVCVSTVSQSLLLTNQC